MTLLDLAGNLHYNDLLQSDDTSVVKILNWLLANLGQLNDTLGTSYQVSGNDAVPELGLDEAGIFGTIYMIHYYQRQQKNNLNASGYDTDWSEIVEGDSRIRRVSRNEVAKNYRLLSNDIRDYLYKIVESYKRFKCVPASIRSSFFCSVTNILQQP